LIATKYTLSIGTSVETDVNVWLHQEALVLRNFLLSRDVIAATRGDGLVTAKGIT
jgi:hypothetical protein